MNSRAIESLIKCGAFDSLGANRRQLLAIYKTALDNVEYESRRNMNGQMSFLVILKRQKNQQDRRFPIYLNFLLPNFCIWKTKLRECILAVIRSMNTQLFQKQSMPIKQAI